MDALKKLGRIIMVIGIGIGIIGGFVIGAAIRDMATYPSSAKLYYLLQLILGVLLVGIAALVVIAGDIVEDEERSVIPDKIGIPISLIGGVLAAIGGVIIGKGFASIDAFATPLPIINIILGVLFCLMGAVVAYTGKFVTEL